MELRCKNKLLLSVGIAGLILFPLLLLFCLQTTQYLLKISAAPRLEGHSQTTLLLHKDSVRWEKPGRELKIEGRYFDVTKLTTQGNHLLITGYFDDVETAVFQLLQKVTHHHTGPGLINRMLLLLQCMVALTFFTLLSGPPAFRAIHQMRPLVLYKNPYLGKTPLPPWLFPTY